MESGLLNAECFGHVWRRVVLVCAHPDILGRHAKRALRSALGAYYRTHFPNAPPGGLVAALRRHDVGAAAAWCIEMGEYTVVEYGANAALVKPTGVDPEVPMPGGADGARERVMQTLVAVLLCAILAQTEHDYGTTSRWRWCMFREFQNEAVRTASSHGLAWLFQRAQMVGLRGAVLLSPVFLAVANGLIEGYTAISPAPVEQQWTEVRGGDVESISLGMMARFVLADILGQSEGDKEADGTWSWEVRPNADIEDRFRQDGSFGGLSVTDRGMRKVWLNEENLLRPPSEATSHLGGLFWYVWYLLRHEGLHTCGYEHPTDSQNKIYRANGEHPVMWQHTKGPPPWPRRRGTRLLVDPPGFRGCSRETFALVGDRWRTLRVPLPSTVLPGETEAVDALLRGHLYPSPGKND